MFPIKLRNAIAGTRRSRNHILIGSGFDFANLRKSQESQFTAPTSSTFPLILWVSAVLTAALLFHAFHGERQPDVRKPIHYRTFLRSDGD